MDYMESNHAQPPQRKSAATLAASSDVLEGLPAAPAASRGCDHLWSS